MKRFPFGHSHRSRHRHCIGRRVRLSNERLESRRQLAAVPFVIESPLVASDHAGPTHVALADLDGDFDLDMLTSSGLDGRIGWYENTDGNGSFGRLHVIADDVRFVEMSIARDLDGDGDLDVAAVISGENRVAWYRNLDGQGTFGHILIVTDTAFDGSSIDAADLDGDGDLDLISTSYDSYDSDVSWYENLNSRGAFGPQRIITTDVIAASSAVAADVDGDGDPDIVSASYIDGKIAWYENVDGMATFGPQRMIGILAGASSVLAVDIDGDQDLDVVAGSYYDDINAVVWFENDLQQGTFALEKTIADSLGGVASMQAVDMDGDTDADLLVADEYDGAVIWYENTDGNGTFSGARTVFEDDLQRLSSAYSGDIDNDGDIDVAFTSFLSDTVAWSESVGLQFAAPDVVTRPGAIGVESVVTHDLDGDGDLDVVAASAIDNTVFWLENLDGHGSFGEKQVIDDALPAAIQVEVHDLNGDLRPDLVVSSKGGQGAVGKVVWYENRGAGSGFGPSLVVAPDLFGTESATAADIDGDGDLDVVATAIYGYDMNLVWVENLDGAGDFGITHVIPNSLGFPRDVVAADLDGDLHVDLAVVSLFDDQVVWFKNLDGLGLFSAQRFLADSNDIPVAIDAGDVDGDGDNDLISASFSDNALVWFQNLDGQGNFGGATTISLESQGPEAIQLADVDGDGDLDALISSIVDNTIGWHENESGIGDFGPRIIIDDDAQSASDVTSGDVDGDGDLDVLGTHYDTSRVVWYRNDTPLFGDVNGDGQRSIDDVDELCLAIRNQSTLVKYDLTGDGLIDQSDLNALIVDGMRTSIGDANLDGVFNSTDLVQVLAGGQYESGIVGSASWSTGDWNCDGEFNSSDIVTALVQGGFSHSARLGTISDFGRAELAVVAEWTRSDRKLHHSAE